ncbi:hypothetical protein J2847_001195 [Azospirillum agricola]|uniref:phenol hydroxylase subunit n=1 Tax=Azospirillum agricola TaxID=1720247 RepID=UPI001AE28843|nr:phenol hydroxylase subunit [Azospirillum agricola]MBP2227913.1 hypothetical protein [Azospirillum agricola]
MAHSMTAYVRVMAIRDGRFVEFAYALGDDDLSVELIMPFAAFDEFCRREGAVMLGPAEAAGAPPPAGPGLYRPPAGAGG